MRQLTDMDASCISRRQFLSYCGGAITLLASRSLHAQYVVSAKIRFRLAKEIKDAFYHAVSPDSRLICVSRTKAPFELAIVEMGSWNEGYSTPLSGDPSGFSFFTDGQRIFGTTTPRTTNRELSIESLLIDLRNGAIQKLQDSYKSDKTIFAKALHDQILIGYQGDRLVQVEWPSFREIIGIAVDRRHTDLQLTADRNRLVHVVGQWLVCRRTEDFAVLWSRKIDSRIDLKETINEDPRMPLISSATHAISADGSTVALAARRTNFNRKTEAFYIEALDAIRRTRIGRWPDDGHEGVALSPDGKLMAIAKMDGKPASFAETPVTGRIKTEEAHLEPTMHIHELPSGREITAVVHDHVSSTRRLGGSLQGGNSGFTPDGKYLITSNSFNTKIWQIDRD